MEKWPRQEQRLQQEASACGGRQLVDGLQQNKWRGGTVWRKKEEALTDVFQQKMKVEVEEEMRFC